MTSPILNVEESLLQSRWVGPSLDEGLVERMVRQFGVPDMIARLLVGRGIKPEEAEAFLYPRLAKDFPDPFSLKGMEDFARDMAQAVSDQKIIGIFGDFDVDGATSTAILVRFFRHLGMDCPIYIPDRVEEGYGPNIKGLKTLKGEGAEIVIICDCGITAFDVIEQGRALGLDIAVLDHHEAEDALPNANHVIDPKRKDDESGLDMLAACGVSFLACVAINAALREDGFYARTGLDEPPLKSWLDIVALGTVCDMVPLTGPNRLIVRTGFKQMADHNNPGIQALCDVSKLTDAPTPYHAGFVLGPRINAGSRVHKADLGAQLLIADDYEDAKNIAWTLNDCNETRKEIQKEMYDQAVAQVKAQGLEDQNVIIVGHEEWHPGLSGLVAGRLKERYGKPSIVVTYAQNENGTLEGRGSGRSVKGVNIGAAFIDARNEGLLVKGGGHAMAAGFTVLPEQLEAFQAFMVDHITRQLAGEVSVMETAIDAILSVNGAQIDVVRMIDDHVGPFGQEHPEPVFALSNVRVHKADIVGQDHVRCMIGDWEGGSWIKAVAFRSKDTPLGEAILKQGTAQPFHLVGSFKINSWQGRESVEFHIQDGVLAMAQAQSLKQAG